jgi:TorA maturation chaperone TorD
MMLVETEVRKEDLLAGRLVVYADLAQCFYYPAKPTISLLKGEMEDHLPFYELVGLDLKPHLDAIKKWMRGYNENLGDMWLDLQREYTRLFIIAKPKVPAPPYGSLYLEKDWLVWGKTTVDAVKFYADAGLKVAEHFKDIPDHFAAELEFMWYLIREEIMARGGALAEGSSEVNVEKAEKMADLQITFLKEHLGVWSENFLGRVRSSARSAFYSEVCAMAGEFISREMRFVTGGVKDNPNAA